MATYLYEAESECYGAGPPPAGGSRRRAIKKRLRAGDTLVVSSLGSLGDSYAAIIDEMRDLMRRRLLVRAINEGLTFDGSVEDAGAQASRDALIGFAAAAAETKKTKKHAGVKPARFWQPESVKDPVATGLRLGAKGVQLGALALAAYLISLAAPGLRQRKLPSPPQIARQSPPNVSAIESPPYTTKDFLIEKEPERSRGSGKGSNPGQSVDDNHASVGNGNVTDEAKVASPPLGLSRDQELRIFSTVGNWRSAKVRNVAVPIIAGTAIPFTVRLATFPRSLVRDEPTLRGYKFVVDGQLIGVIDPVERRIVAVLTGPATGSPP